jgi:hypothetical protein
VGGFWPRIYVIKKGHARDIYFVVADAQFLALQRPLFSLYVLLSTRQCLHRLYWLLSHEASIQSLWALPIEGVCVGIV